MDQVLLFIREAGQDDVINLFPDKASARRALVKYIHERADNSILSSATDDDALVQTYVKAVPAVYAIVGVAGGRR